MITILISLIMTIMMMISYNIDYDKNNCISYSDAGYIQYMYICMYGYVYMHIYIDTLRNSSKRLPLQ